MIPLKINKSPRSHRNKNYDGPPVNEANRATEKKVWNNNAPLGFRCNTSNPSNPIEAFERTSRTPTPRHRKSETLWHTAGWPAWLCDEPKKNYIIFRSKPINYDLAKLSQKFDQLCYARPQLGLIGLTANLTRMCCAVEMVHIKLCAAFTENHPSETRVAKKGEQRMKLNMR